MKKRKSWFSNKRCEICKRQASIFRLIKNKHVVLCDRDSCDYIIRIKNGFFNQELNIKNIVRK